MIDKIFQKAMGFLQNSRSAYDKEKKTDVSEAFTYLLILSIVTAVLSGIVALVTLFSGLLAVTAIVSSYIGMILGAVILGLWLHLWAYIFGAKRGLNQTLKTVFFGGTPAYLLGWIPIVSILASLWSVYIYWIGLQKLHDMPGDKAAFSILIAIIIPIIVMAVVVLMGLALFSSMVGSEYVFTGGNLY